jgi:hypothetical protein
MVLQVNAVAGMLVAAGPFVVGGMFAAGGAPDWGACAHAKPIHIKQRATGKITRIGSLP